MPLMEGIKQIFTPHKGDGHHNHHKTSPSSAKSKKSTASPSHATAQGNLTGTGNRNIPKTSPGLVAGTASKDEARIRAEQIVNAEKQARSKMPSYPGLPEHFVLMEKMGDGAFSNVYKALDTRTNMKVAIKCVRKYELSSNQHGKHLNEKVKKQPRATERANILKEVQIMRKLNHPGIVQLVSFTESAEHYFLVLELMEGGELFHQIVKLTYFSEALARHVILQVAHGIRYLHEEQGVIHRDIKPENLLFSALPIKPSKNPVNRPYDEDKEDEGEFTEGVGGGGIGVVKIADFGLSKIVWNEETMTPCGTVGYTAPEIVKDERYSKSVDMWAMGCVLYTLLCGFPPFYDESINVLTEKVARGYYTFLSPWWDDISASSKDLISKLLCVDPEKRLTIDEFLAHPWCNEKPPSAVPAVQDPANNPSFPRLKTQQQAPMDSPLMAERSGAVGPRTPGAGYLREAFDITYAVHRMEEEGARRNKYGVQNTGARNHLGGLNEEDEEDDEDNRAVVESTRRKYGAEVSKLIEDKRAAVMANAGKSKEPAKNEPYQGWGGADRRLAEAALYDGRAGNRDRGRNKKAGFELNMNNATLLGRRKPGVGPSPLGQQAAAGSPMRVDH